MERRHEGRFQEAGRDKLEECCKEQRQLAIASNEGLVSKWAVVPMTMAMKLNVDDIDTTSSYVLLQLLLLLLLLVVVIVIIVVVFNTQACGKITLFS
jgi:hypothetical protein